MVANARVLKMLTLLALACCPACIIPIPHNANPAEDPFRQNVSRESRDFPVAGTDTRESVLLRLGEPDFTSPDDRQFTYQWIKITGAVGFGVGTHVVTSTNYRYYELEIDFDESGTVSASARSDGRTWKDVR